VLGALVGPTPPVVVINTSGDGLWFALLGLVGVLTGAFISGGFNYAVARRKQRVDETAARKRRALEVRRAARLIDDDLVIAVAAARWTIENKLWFGQPLTSIAWQQYRETLASGTEVSGNGWRSLMVATLTIDQLQSERDRLVKWHHTAKSGAQSGWVMPDAMRNAMASDPDYFEPSLVPDEELAQIEQWEKDLQEGRDVLASVMEEARPVAATP
jgi:hypothetical protein